MSVRDRLIESWNDTQQYFREQDPKRVYYLSMEFLMGRSLTNSLFNLDLNGTYREALKQLGYEMENLVEKERDAALGNGGLGRLAACFLDSMASENLPAWGYGIRYQYGMFRQEVIEGFQHENPDYWLNFGNPWEIETAEHRVPDQVLRERGDIGGGREAGLHLEQRRGGHGDRVRYTDPGLEHPEHHQHAPLVRQAVQGV